MKKNKNKNKVQKCGKDLKQVKHLQVLEKHLQRIIMILK